MLLLSYNPQDDEFFIGLSLEEFEKISLKYNIDYGYNSNYVLAKESAINKYADATYTKMIKEFYQIENMPFICIVKKKGRDELQVQSAHFPFAPLWNGYSPWQRIVVKQIDDSNCYPVTYVDFPTVLHSFCDEWIKKFSDDTVSHYALIENNNFPNYCMSFGWIVDDGISFMKVYPCDSYEEALLYLPQVNKIDLLGNLIFSYWRYFSHWAYHSDEILLHKEWFVRALTRLKELA